VKRMLYVKGLKQYTRWDGRYFVVVFLNKNVTRHRNSLSYSDGVILVSGALGNILLNPVFVGCPLVTVANITSKQSSLGTRVLSAFLLKSCVTYTSILFNPSISLYRPLRVLDVPIEVWNPKQIRGPTF
jgi:hypothetical protein